MLTNDEMRDLIDALHAYVGDDLGRVKHSLVSLSARHHIRRSQRAYDGVRVRGSRGDVTIRIRGDRWQVIREPQP